MKYYIGTKLVKAEPCMLDSKPGYRVEYSDGYDSWSPQDVFEKSYLPVEENIYCSTGVSIGYEMVVNFIKDIEVETIGEKTTLVKATLINGFEIIETSACVDKNNYNIEIGTEICMKKIKDQIWYLLGFLLQTACNGIKE